MTASRCAVCSGAMVIRLVEADPSDSAKELRIYECNACGHSQTYSVDGGDSCSAISTAGVVRTQLSQQEKDHETYAICC